MAMRQYSNNQPGIEKLVRSMSSTEETVRNLKLRKGLRKTNHPEARAL